MLSFLLPSVMIAEADAYAELRGWSDWVGENAAKQGAIRRSQDFIAATYNTRWAEVWSTLDTPPEVKFAIIEGALRELRTPHSLNPDVVVATARKRVKVEGAVEVEYATGGAKLTAADMRPDISIIDALLAGHLRKAGGGSVTVDTLRV